jgi:hypothetical protein
VAGAAPFVSVVKETREGIEFFTYSLCMEEAATTCTGGGIAYAFSEPIDGGWRGIITGTAGFDTNCTITYTEQTALLDGTALVVETKQHAETVGAASGVCTIAEAEKRNTAMPCVRHERIDGVRL